MWQCVSDMAVYADEAWTQLRPLDAIEGQSAPSTSSLQRINVALDTLYDAPDRGFPTEERCRRSLHLYDVLPGKFVAVLNLVSTHIQRHTPVTLFFMHTLCKHRSTAIAHAVCCLVRWSQQTWSRLPAHRLEVWWHCTLQH